MNERQNNQRADGTEVFDVESSEGSGGIVGEVWELVRLNKKWWLLPILFVLLLSGLIVALSGTVFAPFIYPLF
jgi:hypothetical protein